MTRPLSWLFEDAMSTHIPADIACIHPKMRALSLSVCLALAGLTAGYAGTLGSDAITPEAPLHAKAQRSACLLVGSMMSRTSSVPGISVRSLTAPRRLCN